MQFGALVKCGWMKVEQIDLVLNRAGRALLPFARPFVGADDPLTIARWKLKVIGPVVRSDKKSSKVQSCRRFLFFYYY